MDEKALTGEPDDVSWPQGGGRWEDGEDLWGMPGNSSDLRWYFTEILPDSRLTWTLPDRGWKTNFHYESIIFRVELLIHYM